MAGAEEPAPPTRAPAGVVAGQAALYIATGLWPLLSRRTFEQVTGPKSEFWLVQIVGLLVGSIGVGLAQSLRRGRAIPPELRTVAIGSAASLAAADVIFVAKGRIRPVYLADALAELALVAAWLREPSS
jgi:hypothetical protein